MRRLLLGLILACAACDDDKIECDGCFCGDEPPDCPTGFTCVAIATDVFRCVLPPGMADARPADGGP